MDGMSPSARAKDVKSNYSKIRDNSIKLEINANM